MRAWRRGVETNRVDRHRQIDTDENQRRGCAVAVQLCLAILDVRPWSSKLYRCSWLHTTNWYKLQSLHSLHSLVSLYGHDGYNGYNGFLESSSKSEMWKQTPWGYHGSGKADCTMPRNAAGTERTWHWDTIRYNCKDFDLTNWMLSFDLSAHEPLVFLSVKK